jgi:putative transposase
LIARHSKRQRPTPSLCWGLDNLVGRIGGKLCRAAADERKNLDLVVHRRRGTEAALRLLRGLLYNYLVEPEMITTGDLLS